MAYKRAEVFSLERDVVIKSLSESHKIRIKRRTKGNEGRDRGYIQGCGSGSVSGSGLDPDSIGSVDPDQDRYSESGSGSRRAKMTHKS